MQMLPTSHALESRPLSSLGPGGRNDSRRGPCFPGVGIVLWGGILPLGLLMEFGSFETSIDDDDGESYKIKVLTSYFIETDRASLTITATINSKGCVRTSARSTRKKQ
ncbi:uncharacterized protein LY79DRAFT_410923 [Colletotrichum navitas]|uniref:Uncharacterized protein n=1 Tax=Colletotrichum navitas TaxID=681940 RepID=A0AAD8V0S5_9PEZI|nr:uncharacterized protein LY79DRAFT_410923 [Colletotrichum navitas]KAK1573569.1 hypothetical protein LY79DRAFT_410923 [Colletotrichum navitas]